MWDKMKHSEVTWLNYMYADFSKFWIFRFWEMRRNNDQDLMSKSYSQILKRLKGIVLL